MCPQINFQDKTVQELENDYWPPPDLPTSHLVAECHRLRTVPLKDFTVENLRIMIGQELCLDYLMPLALIELEKDPMVAGDLYPGDLLGYVKGRDRFFKEHPELKARLDKAVAR